MIANEVARLATTILAEYAIAARKIKDTKNAPEATVDATQQLARLMPKRFLVDSPWAQLPHFVRYLKAVTARLDESCICIVVPSMLALNWAHDETEVAIRATVAAGDAALGILIEKDFECLAPRAGEDQGNRFTNPNKPG